MNLKTFLFDLFPKTLNYKLARWGIAKPTSPITLTFSITAACQSNCKTCRIGEKYHEDPSRAEEDLSTEEIDKIFESLGHVYFFNISGGEPFLRDDLIEIVDLARKHLQPGIVHIPTNALMPERIKAKSKEILELLSQQDSGIQYTLKPSIDGVGEKHDEIRGVKGNFKKLVRTVESLKSLEREYPNFHLELGTVVSRYNIDHLDEIEDFVHDLDIESYRNEIAEQREEFFNLDDEITPSWKVYKRLMERFSQKIKENIQDKKYLTRITEAFRLVYYDLAVKIVKKKTQIIPCYGGISNVHINFDGEVWPCCTLGYSKPLGNLREVEYDFWEIWHSDQAKEIRTYIKKKKCHCPLANQTYSNILIHWRTLLKVLFKMIRFS